MSEIRGNCPACGRSTLFLGNGGYVTCGWIGEPPCPNPCAASDLLRRPSEARNHDDLIEWNLLERLKRQGLLREDVTVADARRYLDD